MGVCKVCGNDKGQKYFLVKERQLNQGEEFEYMLCSKCQTLQLDQEIEDMGKFYPKDYYSFRSESFRMKIPRMIVKPVLALSSKGKLGGGYSRILDKIAALSLSIYGTGANFHDRVLDVGGGNGLLASFLQKNGFQNVTCIDYFCEKSPYKNIKFKQCDITELSDDCTYDLITFKSSFEHMKEPHKVLDKVKMILSESGKCLIAIPVFGSKAWELYQENWYQIDAPRHYYLYSVCAMKKLCVQHGLKVEKIRYHSGPLQFYTSMQYRDTELNFEEIHKKYKSLSIASRRKFVLEAKKADKNQRGDVVWFYIGHK